MKITLTLLDLAPQHDRNMGQAQQNEAVPQTYFLLKAFGLPACGRF